MTNPIQDLIVTIKSQGWQQGSLIRSIDAEHIKSISIDHFSHPVTTDSWLVVLTQDCDLVRETTSEPYVELLALKAAPKKPDNPARGQSSRLINLTIGINNATQWLQGSIHDRFRIEKASLINLNIDKIT